VVTGVLNFVLFGVAERKKDDFLTILFSDVAKGVTYPIFKYFVDTSLIKISEKNISNMFIQLLSQGCDYEIIGWFLRQNLSQHLQEKECEILSALNSGIDSFKKNHGEYICDLCKTHHKTLLKFEHHLSIKHLLGDNSSQSLFVPDFRAAWLCIFDFLTLKDTLSLFSVSSYFNNNYSHSDDLWIGWSNTILLHANKHVKENWDVCLNCRKLFLEEKNGPQSCVYHTVKTKNGVHECCHQRKGCNIGEHVGKGVTRSTKEGCHAILEAIKYIYD